MTRLLTAAAALVLLLTAGACTPARKAAASPAATTANWAPNLGQRWQIQLGGRFDPSIRARFYDLDPYATAQDTVHRLNALGRRTICHLDVGVSDASLPDATMLPPRVLGRSAGAGHRWIDIRAWSRLEPVLANRIDLCRAKGFQGIDADAADGYAYQSGFDLTAADQVAFDGAVIDLAHRAGLQIAVRTPLPLVAALAPLADFAIVDGCVRTRTCDAYRRYVAVHKAVLDVETGPAPDFCPLALYYRFAVIAKPDGLSEPAVTYC